MKYLLIILSLAYSLVAGAQSKPQIFLMIINPAPTGGSTAQQGIDTIALHWANNSTMAVSDSATSFWNNAVGANGTTLERTSMKWKRDGSLSGIGCSWVNGSIATNTHSCSGEVAPNTVMTYVSSSAGSTSLGDATLGGRYLTITGLDPLKTYDYVHLAARTSNTGTVTVKNGNQTAGLAINNNCSQIAKLTGLVPNGSGVLTILVYAQTPTGNCYSNGFYLITSR